MVLADLPPVWKALPEARKNSTFRGRKKPIKITYFQDCPGNRWGVKFVYVFPFLLENIFPEKGNTKTKFPGNPRKVPGQSRNILGQFREKFVYVFSCFLLFLALKISFFRWWSGTVFSFPMLQGKVDHWDLARCYLETIDLRRNSIYSRHGSLKGADARCSRSHHLSECIK